MTNFKAIQNYYDTFNENERLTSDNSGRLEYEMTMKQLKKYLPPQATILDLGGATGVYTFPLAEAGYKLYLADLSTALIEIAKDKLKNKPNENIISCDVVNAIDLHIYQDETFDVILLFGPLYHLLEEQERTRCLQEINRVLKKNGLVFASFIPYLSGSIAILDRYFRHPEQVNRTNLQEVFKSGKFNNNAHSGFQEGYYPTRTEIDSLFKANNFKKISISSIRSFAYEKEDKLYSITDQEMFNTIISLLEETSEKPELIETCGHALYIGQKMKNL